MSKSSRSIEDAVLRVQPTRQVVTNHTRAAVTMRFRAFSHWLIEDMHVRVRCAQHQPIRDVER